jgi:hypothetical protein
MVRSLFKILFTLSLITLATTNVWAESYISLKGKFYISYPDEWAEVDYRLVDAFLYRSRPDTTIPEYDAVFARKTARDFFSEDYCILTVDTIGNLTNAQIDSVLVIYAGSFDAQLKQKPFPKSVDEPENNVFFFDILKRTAVLYRVMTELGSDTRVHLLVLQFYERGIASFYFYSQESQFNTTKDIFKNVVNSFATENISERLPKETLKVANLKTDKNEGKENSNLTLYLILAVAALLVIFAVGRRLL